MAKAGNARVRRGLVHLAWRLLLFQKDSALSQWYRARTGVQGVRKTVLMVLSQISKVIELSWTK